MSADTRTRKNDFPASVQASSPLSQVATNNLPSRPGPSVPGTHTSSNGPATRDVNALRAAALKSSRMKKLKAEAEARSQSAIPTPPPRLDREEGEIEPPPREDGEISEEGEWSPSTPAAPPLPFSAPKRPTIRTTAPLSPAPPSPGITRSTVVTISPGQATSPNSAQAPRESTPPPPHRLGLTR